MSDGVTVEGLVRLLCLEHEERAEVVDLVSGRVESRLVRVPGLLRVLGEETAPGLERGSGRRVAGPGVPVAVDLLDLAERIRGELLRDLLRLGDRVRVLPLADLCLDWYRAWLASEPSPAEHAPWVEELAGWRDAVLGLLDPPVVMTVTRECPVCRARRVADAEGLESDALSIAYRREHPMDTVELVCRACGPVARGVLAVRAAIELREEMSA